MNDQEKMRSEWERLAATLDIARADAQECGESNTETDFYDAAFWKACHALLLAPAPDVAGLVRKLEIFREHKAWEEYDGDQLLESIIADARRLAGA